MNTLVVVSPTYLDALTEELKKYSFYIQGYRSILKACNRLHYVNETDVIGYIFVGDRLPANKYMEELIRKINLRCVRETLLVLAVKDGTSLKKFTQQHDSSKDKVKIKYITDFDVLNDKIINVGLVGSILKSRFKPYLFDDDDMPITNNSMPQNLLEYSLPLDDYEKEIYAKVNTNLRKDISLSDDRILVKYEALGGERYDLRRAYIKAHYGELVDISEYKDENKDNYLFICSLENVLSTIVKESKNGNL